MLDADIRLRLDRLSLDAVLHAEAGEVVAVLGPNGSGKSTILRALAGLLALTGGRVELDGQVLDDPATRTRVAPERRPVALMFQEYLLFPHMSALENVAFGLRARGTDRRDARQRAAAALERLGVGPVAAARPGGMSGGQQQRVAMARALVTEPRLLLLDEPLAALDVSTKAEVRRHLRSVLTASTSANLLVTHDLLDAVALASRMVVIENGGIVQSGTPAEVTARPRSQYVADLTGVNLLRGTARGTAIDVDGGGQVSTEDGHDGPVLAVPRRRCRCTGGGRRPASRTSGRAGSAPWTCSVTGSGYWWTGRRRSPPRSRRVRWTSTSSTTAARCGCPSPPARLRRTRHEHRATEPGRRCACATACSGGGVERDGEVERTVGTTYRQGAEHMELSAHNQLKGTITGVKSGAVMAEVTVHIQAGQVTSVITDSSRERLNLKEGDQVTVVVKSTEVMIGKG